MDLAPGPRGRSDPHGLRAARRRFARHPVAHRLPVRRLVRPRVLRHLRRADRGNLRRCARLQGQRRRVGADGRLRRHPRHQDVRLSGRTSSTGSPCPVPGSPASRTRGAQPASGPSPGRPLENRIADEQQIALVVNPPGLERTQDQLHVHLVRLGPGARARLAADSPARTPDLDQVWDVAARHAAARGLATYGVLVMRDDGGPWLPRARAARKPGVTVHRRPRAAEAPRSPLGRRHSESLRSRPVRRARVIAAASAPWARTT